MKKLMSTFYFLFLYLFFNAATLSGSMVVSLGNIVIANPVVASFGNATLALAVVAHNAFKNYVHKKLTLVSETIDCVERLYYLSRKNELELLRQQLLVIKSDLEKIHGLNVGAFTHQFLQHYTYDVINSVWLPSLEHEKQLSDEGALQLRQVREDNLALLEKQIEGIQLLLALHVNQVINDVHDAQYMYDKLMPGISDAIIEWNKKALSLDDALQAYKCDLLQEYLMSRIARTINELVIVSSYYRNCKNLCIQKSTNIIVTLENLTLEIDEKRKWISEQEYVVGKNIVISEHYFAQRNIVIAEFKTQTKKEFEKQTKEYEAQVFDNVASQLAAGVPSGPKKDNEDDTKSFWENLKLRSDKKARSTRFGKVYRDSITKLWWSQDLAGHGGSCYKVFKETAKGFEWVYDAAKDGTRILNKHKGPTGLFIPYKEVIFRT